MQTKSNSFQKLIAFIFHPIIYPLLATLFYMYLTPHYFNITFQWYILLIVSIGTIAIPLLILFILKLSDSISTFLLTDAHERKYPFVLFTIIALLLSSILIKNEATYDLGVYFISGGLAFIVGYWLLFVGRKVSLHTMGIGSFIGFIIEMGIIFEINYLPLIMLLFLLFGIVAFNRIELKAHSLKETIYGFFIGFFPQLLIPFVYQNI